MWWRNVDKSKLELMWIRELKLTASKSHHDAEDKSEGNIDIAPEYSGGEIV